MEKSIKKKKANKSDKELPRSGLNPGIIPDKGPNSWNSFNSMNSTDGVSFGACFEDFDKLTEEAFNDKSFNTAIRSCFSSNTIEAMNKDKISNAKYEDIINTDNKDYLPKDLEPSTQSLCFNSNKSGSRDELAKNERKVVHHVFGVHPDKKGNKNILDDIIVYLPLQTNTSVNNTIFKTIAENALNDSKAKAIGEKYIKGIEILNGKLAKADSAKEAADIFWRKVELKAWFIREIWSLKSIFTLRKVQTSAQADAVRDQLVSGPASLLKWDSYYKLGGKYFAIIINSIGDNQIKSAELSGLKNLKNDFICAIEVDPRTGYIDGETYTDFNEFVSKYPEVLTEELLESESFDRYRKVDLTKYLQHNISKRIPVDYESSKKSINQYFDDSLNQIIKRFSPTSQEERQKLFGNHYYSGDELYRVIWSAPFGSDLFKLKQKIIGEYVRYILNYGPRAHLEIALMSEPEYDSKSGLYLIKVGDLELQSNENDDKFELDLNRESKIPLEDIYSYIKSGKMINKQIIDKHFLDSEGNPVPGIKFVYDSRGIIDITRTQSCEVDKIFKVIVNISKSYNAKVSIGSMLSNAGIKNLDTLEIVGDILAPDAFSFVKCNNIVLKNFKSGYLPMKSFRYLDCPTFNIPPSVISIGESCFAGSRLKSIFIPETVKNIGNKAFEGCSQLTVNFEIDKSELDSSRSRYSSGKYSGYNTKWGKTDVAKVTYGNAVALESLKEDDEDSFLSYNYGMPIASNSKYELNELISNEEIEDLKKYLGSILDNQSLANSFVGSIYDYGYDDKNRKCYFIENKSDAGKSYIYNPHYITLKYIKNNGTDHVSFYDAFKDDAELRDILLFKKKLPGLSGLSDIIDAQKIKPETPVTDKQYILDDYLNDLDAYTKPNSLIYIILKTLKAGDYIEVLDLCDLGYPKFSDHIESVKKALESPEGKALLDSNNIDINDIVDSLSNNNSELYYIIKSACIKTLVNTKIEQIYKYVQDKVESDDFEKININRKSAKVNLLKLFDENKDLNKENLEDKLYSYIKSRVSDKMSDISTTSGYYSKGIKDEIGNYKLNAKRFLLNLDNELKTYYN